MDEEVFAELSKFIEFFGGRIENVTEAFRVSDKLGLSENFQFYRRQVFQQHETAPNVFNKKTHLISKKGETEKGRELRMEYLRHLTARMGEYNEGGPKKSGSTDVLPVVCGRSEASAWNIGMTGFNYSPTLDPGHFGSGIYFTTSLEYALAYGSWTVFALANPGNVYPVIEHPFEKEGTVLGDDGKEIVNEQGYFGKPCVPGYQSHYSLGKRWCLPFL